MCPLSASLPTCPQVVLGDRDATETLRRLAEEVSVVDIVRFAVLGVLRALQGGPKPPGQPPRGAGQQPAAQESALLSGGEGPVAAATAAAAASPAETIELLKTREKVTAALYIATQFRSLGAPARRLLSAATCPRP